MEVIIINNTDYYKADDIYKKTPTYFYGCANNPRNIVDKKKISVNDHIYAYIKSNKWVKSYEKYNRARLLLKKEWVDNNVPDIDISKDIKADIQLAPPLIELNDNDHFISHDGNKLNIRIRGNRDTREFYFSVQDVSKEFKLPSLYKVLIDNRKDGYIENSHYKYYFISKHNNINKYEKELYLTHSGITKCIFVTKSKFIELNQEIILKWINNIVYNLQFNNHNLIQNNDININTRGVVYIVNSPFMESVVKMGFWRGKMNGLFQRYMTYCSKQMTIIYYDCENCPLAERELFAHFIGYNIIQELFDKKYIDKYIEYLDNKYGNKGILNIEAKI